MFRLQASVPSSLTSTVSGIRSRTSCVKESALFQASRVDGLRVAVVDDEPLARSRMNRLLSSVGGPSVQVVLECRSAEEFLSRGPQATLDAAFVDVEMPGGDGLEAVTRWPGRRPQIIVVTAHQEHALRAFEARAIDYLTKPVSEVRLRQALDRARAYRLNALLSQSHSLAGATPGPALSSRQLEILALVAENRSNKEIGRALNLSHFTVRNHLSTLYRLFGVDGRRGLMDRAAQARAVRPHDREAVSRAHDMHGWTGAAGAAL